MASRAMVKGTLLHPELKICRYPTCSPVPQAASWQQMMHNACVCMHWFILFTMMKNRALALKSELMF
jgi:hypothetical protein